MRPHNVDTTATLTPADWTPEQQLAHMLELCEAQMESAMQESDTAVDSLIQSFTSLAETMRGLGEILAKLPEEQRAQTDGLDEKIAAMKGQISSAIVAFQFYDKLSQRLGHVRYSLSTLAMFVCDRQQMGQRDQWKRLLTTLRRLYRTEEERKIFLLMAGGMSAEQAMNKDAESPEPLDAAPAGDIELF